MNSGVRRNCILTASFFKLPRSPNTTAERVQCAKNYNLLSRYHYNDSAQSSTIGVFIFCNCVYARKCCKWFALRTALVNVIVSIVINVFIYTIEHPALSIHCANGPLKLELYHAGETNGKFVPRSVTCDTDS